MLLVGDIPWDDHRAGAARGDLGGDLIQRLTATRGEDERGLLVRPGERKGAADPHRGASDDHGRHEGESIPP